MYLKHLLPLVLLVSCQPQIQIGSISLLQEAGEGTSPAGDGPFAVGLFPRVLVERGRPSFDFDLFLPLSDSPQEPYPILIFVQGGLVERSEYHWFATRAASWGFVVAVPQYPLDLALFGKSRTRDTIDALEVLSERPLFAGLFDTSKIAVGGHSLGGVASDRATDRDDRISALFFWGSFPGDNDGDQFSGAALSVAGASDCLTSTEEALDGITLYNTPKAYAEIEGVTHFQFTNSEDKDIEDGCIPGVSLEEAHEKISALTIAFLYSSLYADDRFLSEFTSPREGVTTQTELSAEGSFFAP